MLNGKYIETERVENRDEEARELIFSAQAIIDVTRAADGGDVPAHETSTKRALEIAYEMLDKAAFMLCPGSLTAVSEPAEVGHE